MSEPKKKSEILQEQIDFLKSEIKRLEKTTLTTSTKPHSHSANVEFDCPDCQKAYDAEVVAKARPEIEKTIREKHKSLEDPVICKDCGEIVEKEIEECPTCHGKEAREIGK